jgi:hypothetical protein
MKKLRVAYIVPYFGKFPKYFPIWLKSCEMNPTIDWLIFTDDKTSYQYPNSVKVQYISFDKLKSRIQKLFDFEIGLETPYRLCDFRVAFG